MLELPLVLLGGMLGSSHCLGMCGAFAVSVGLASPSVADNLRRQLVYSLGRISTYTFLGSVAGFVGWRFSRVTFPGVNLQGWLAILAGLVLIGQGLQAAGVWRLRRIGSVGSGFCPGRRLFSTFLASPRILDAFLAGVLTGFLPCGLVYAYLALATSSAHPVWGGATMSAFGLGTTPLMMLAGFGPALLGAVGRRNLLRLAAVSVIVTGGLTVHRGIHAAWTSPAETQGGCPYCVPADPGPGPADQATGRALPPN